MRTHFRISSLVPSGLLFQSVSDSTDSIILLVRSGASQARCPLCGAGSRRVHSRYIRSVADLPSAGRAVQLQLVTRRFTCEVPHCRRRIFAERFGEAIVCLGRVRRRDAHAAIDWYQDRAFVNLTSKRIQVDEIWAFIYAKQKNVPAARSPPDAGDAWTWTAIDADTKLILSWYVGGRDSDARLLHGRSAGN